MDPIIFLDEAMLYFVKKMTRAIYLLFGINNFRLAYISIQASIISGIFFSVVMVCRSPLKAEAVKFLLLVLLFNTVAFFYTRHVQAASKKDMMNCARLGIMSYARVALNIMGLLMGSSLVLVGLQDLEIMLFIILILMSVVLPLFVFSIASVEPEDPTDSFLKKFWKKFKSLFETKALPQPS